MSTLTKPILFLFHYKGLHVIIYLDDILILTGSKHAGMRAQTFLYSHLVCHGLHVNLSKADLCLMQQFCFFGWCWNTVEISVSLLSDKLHDIQQLAQVLLWSQPVTVQQVMSFLDKMAFGASDHA